VAAAGHQHGLPDQVVAEGAAQLGRALEGGRVGGGRVRIVAQTPLLLLLLLLGEEGGLVLFDHLRRLTADNKE